MRITHLGWLEVGCEKPFKIRLLNVAYFANSTKRCAHTTADKGSLEIRDPNQFFKVTVFWSFKIDTTFTFPTHTCKHQPGKALQEQRFQRPHMKVVGWWAPQRARGRRYTLYFPFSTLKCKVFVKKMLQLGAVRWAAESDHLNAFSPGQR